MKSSYDLALGTLREVVAGLKPGHPVHDEIIAGRDKVFARFQPVFSLEHIDNLSREEYTPFLYLEHNHHWSNLYRTGLGTADDMKLLRKALRILLDESRPIRERFPESIAMVRGFGKGIATGILLVAYPDRYGVWNNTSQGGLQRMGLWPDFDRGEGAGGRYERINSLLLRLAKDLGVDLWTLDSLWWVVLDPSRHGSVQAKTVAAPSGEDATSVAPGGERFALERQLEDFLVENWNRTPFAKEWAIYTTEEDSAAGNQFPTDVGPIDILARHKSEPRWLVIELKRERSSDQAVGQVLRYSGWIKQHLARPGESVEGLVIAHNADKAARYAISMIPSVKLVEYEVTFHLREISLDSQ